jgi:hypothetical protein
LVSDDLYSDFLKNKVNFRSYLGVDRKKDLFIVSDEIELFELFSLIVLLLDPDFLGAWDIEQRSLHYLVSRGKVFDLDVLAVLGRG